MHLILKSVIVMMDQIGNEVLISLTGALVKIVELFKQLFFLLN